MIQLVSIQILRALAAFLVAVAHTQSDMLRLNAPTLPDGFVIGAAGVDLFFVISGFVIVYSSEPMFGRRGAPAYFFLRRLIRVVPLYWAVTTFFIGYLIWQYGDVAPAGQSLTSIAASYFFVPYINPAGNTSPALGVGWTLNYEMFFYALFAAFIWLPRMAATLCVALALCMLVLAGQYALIPEPYSIWSSTIVLEFAFGAMIALALRAGCRIPIAASVSMIAIAAAAFAWSATINIGDYPRFLVWGLPAAALVAACALSRSEFGPSFPRWPALLGDASYALYLTHGMVIAASRRVLPLIIDPTNTLAYTAAALAVCLIVAVAIYLFLERPLTLALQGVVLRRFDYRQTMVVRAA